MDNNPTHALNYYWMFVAYFYYLQNLETFHSAKFFCRSISFAQMRGCKRVLDDPLKKPCCGQKWVLATLIKTLRAAKNEYWWPFSLTFWPLFFSNWVLKTLTWPNLSTLALWDHILRYHNACIEFQPVFEYFRLEFFRLSFYRIISRSVDMIILRAQSYSEV